MTRWYVGQEQVGRDPLPVTDDDQPEPPLPLLLTAQGRLLMALRNEFIDALAADYFNFTRGHTPTRARKAANQLTEALQALQETTE